jgi:Fic family protein
LEGVAAVAIEATETARRLVSLFENDRRAIHELGRKAHVPLLAHELLKGRVATTITNLAKVANVTFPTASTALQRLVTLGIAKEITGRSRDQLFVYDKYLAALSDPV